MEAIIRTDTKPKVPKMPSLWCNAASKSRKRQQNVWLYHDKISQISINSNFTALIYIGDTPYISSYDAVGKFYFCWDHMGIDKYQLTTLISAKMSHQCIPNIFFVQFSPWSVLFIRLSYLLTSSHMKCWNPIWLMVLFIWSLSLMFRDTCDSM